MPDWLLSGMDLLGRECHFTSPAAEIHSLPPDPTPAHRNGQPLHIQRNSAPPAHSGITSSTTQPTPAPPAICPWLGNGKPIAKPPSQGPRPLVLSPACRSLLPLNRRNRRLANEAEYEGTATRYSVRSHITLTWQRRPRRTTHRVM